MLIAKEMTQAESDKYGVTLEGMKRWSKETGKEIRRADTGDIRPKSDKVRKDTAVFSDKAKNIAKNNSFSINDPIQDALRQYTTLISVSKDGAEEWAVETKNADKMDKAIERAFKKLSRDDYNFWTRLTGDPTFMGLKYSAQQTREKLHSAGINKGFFQVNVGGHSAVQFLSEGKYAAAVYSKTSYDDRYYNFIQSGGICREYQPGSVFKIGGNEYTVGENGKINVPYGADIWDIGYPKKEE